MEQKVIDLEVEISWKLQLRSSLLVNSTSLKVRLKYELINTINPLEVMESYRIKR